MFLSLFLLFTLVPLVELFLLIEIGRRVGPLPTVALVVATGALGAWLARSQGVATLRRVREEWAAGRIPTDALLDGLMILIAGAVLLTPGLLTDLLGFFLLVPAGRRLTRRALVARFKRHVTRIEMRGAADYRYRAPENGPADGDRPSQDEPRTIEIEDWEEL